MEIEARQPSDRFSVLLIVLLENRRLLLVAPLVFGVLAFAVVFLLPPQFTSRAILDLSIASPATISNTSFHGSDVQSFPPSAVQAAATIVSPSILAPVIERPKLSDALGVPSTSAGLARQIKVVASRDGFLDISPASIGVLRTRYFLESLNIPKYLRGLMRDVVKQPPILSM